jgi:E3 ubiquitin-protein ligase BRE1
MLRIEFEQNLAANEQTGPINKEMRNLITSLQTHNVQLKGEVARYKRKSKETQLESTKLRTELDAMKTAEIRALQQAKKLQELHQQQQQEQQRIKQEREEKVAGQSGGDFAESGEASGVKTETAENADTEAATAAGDFKPKVKEEAVNDQDLKLEIDESVFGGEDGAATASQSAEGSPTTTAAQTPVKKEAKAESPNFLKELRDKIEELTKVKGKDQETMKELKAQLKKAQNDLKEMKLLLGK